MYHSLNVTCLIKFELGVRDLAWRWSLKQSCSIWYKEQLLFLGHWMIQLLTCLKLDHKSQQNKHFNTYKKFFKSCSLTDWQADIGGDIAQFWLWISTSSLNKNCKWYLGLQLLFWNHSLNGFVSGDNSNEKLAVRLGFGINWRTESLVSVADWLRAEPTRGGQRMPHVAGASPCVAKAG